MDALVSFEFLLAGKRVRVRSASAQELKCVEAIWAPACADLEQPPDHDIVIDHRERLWVNESLKIYPEQSPEVMAQLQWYLVFGALRDRTEAVHLHAAAIVFKQIPILFVAASGSGKSSLTRQGLLAGASYITDDCLILENNQGFGVGRTIQFAPIPYRSSPPSYLNDCDLDSFQLIKKRGAYTFPLWRGNYTALPFVPLCGRNPWVVVRLARGERNEIEPLDQIHRLAVLHESVITSGREYAGELGYGPSFLLTWKDPQRAFELLLEKLDNIT